MSKLPTTLAELFFVSLLLGLRHALEPDHLAAVSVLVGSAGAKPRNGFGTGALLGAFWGAGHTLSIVLLGGALLAARVTLPERAAAGLELLVAAMLIGLGVRALARAFREGQTGFAAAHRHGDQMPHGHVGPRDHAHVYGWVLGRGPLAVGLVHGLAGTGALAAFVLGTLPNPISGALYLAVFGLGSLCGMSLLTGFAGTQLPRFARHRRALGALTGALSLGMGLFWAFEQWRTFSA
ncbi:MAG: high-affinity nickel-transport family protein [Deltaproteobacteria bacterium]